MTDFRVTETYRKDTHHPAGHGYGRNIGTSGNPKWVATRGVTLSSVIVHTTNNSQKNTKIWNEATFIRDSPDVSCHDLIGKDGSIYVILPPNMQAWHAGVALKNFTNPYSLGFEIHCSVGETPTQAQKDALAWRLQQYIGPYGLQAADIDTHRAVALPKGRKSDPENWPDAEFYPWRDRLFASTPTLPPGTFPVDARLELYWGRSGGVWQPDRYALGYAISALTNGVQQFERGALRLNLDGSISPLLRSEW